MIGEVKVEPDPTHGGANLLWRGRLVGRLTELEAAASDKRLAVFWAVMHHLRRLHFRRLVKAAEEGGIDAVLEVQLDALAPAGDDSAQGETG